LYHYSFTSKKGKKGGERMKKKVLVIFISLLTVAMLATPVMAKTKTAVYVVQAGTADIFSGEKYLDTPNGRMNFAWGLDGAGAVTLYEENQITIIDTFASSSVIDAKAKDSTTYGFMDGVLTWHIKMLWESNTHEDSGFEGVMHWRAIDGLTNAEFSAVYQGFGYYKGQTLKLSGTFVPMVGQVYTGILIS
jgi:hypothetical protein